MQTFSEYGAELKSGKDADKILERDYAKAPAISVDYALLEKSKKVAVVLGQKFGWNDLGSFVSLDEVYPAAEGGVARAKQVMAIDSIANVVDCPGKTVVSPRRYQHDYRGCRRCFTGGSQRACARSEKVCGAFENAKIRPNLELQVGFLGQIFPGKLGVFTMVSFPLTRCWVMVFFELELFSESSQTTCRRFCLKKTFGPRPSAPPGGNH